MPASQVFTDIVGVISYSNINRQLRRAMVRMLIPPIITAAEDKVKPELKEMDIR